MTDELRQFYLQMADATDAYIRATLATEHDRSDLARERRERARIQMQEFEGQLELKCQACLRQLGRGPATRS